MPPKIFTCSLCRKQVTKPKSYALGDGSRACRHHQEAFQKHQELTKAIANESRLKALQKHYTINRKS